MRPAVTRLLALALLAVSACTAKVPLRRIPDATTPDLQPRRTVAPQSSATPASPLPSVPPDPPALLAQPVVLNPGSAAAKNFVVLSAAKQTAQATVSVASGTAAYRVSAGIEAPEAAFRDWQNAQLAGVRPPRYRTVSTVATLVPGVEKTFYVITRFGGTGDADTPVSARLEKVGQHCYVFVDDAVAQDASEASTVESRVAKIADTFDTTIYPTDTRLFGSEPNPGIDGDPHVYILLSPAVGNYGQDNTLGYFAQRDEYLPSQSGSALLKHSNAKEMIYISSHIVATGSEEDYLGTIAHEFQHMINFNQKVLLGGNSSSEDLWIDEGMAMYAIEACGYGLKSGGQVLANHVRRFEQSPDAYSLTDWTQNPEGIGYGPVYLFMVYLADHFSESIIRDIVTAKQEGIPNIDAQLRKRGTSFARVFHDWCVANLLDGRPEDDDPRYEYQSLKLRGQTGQTTLDGFAVTPLQIPGTLSFPMRNYLQRFYQLPSGVLAPHFTLTPSAGTGTASSLQLP